MRTFLFSLILIFVSTTCGLGDVVVDQENVFVSGVNATVNSSGEIGQTFIVGQTGILDHIDVFMSKPIIVFLQPGDALLSVYNTAGGLPTGPALATKLVLRDTIPTTTSFITFDVKSSAIQVNENETFAFGITSTGTQSYALPFTTDNYASGDSVGRTLLPAGPWSIAMSFNGMDDVKIDYSFRTFVDAVPEPSSFAISMLLATVFSLRRRK